MPPALLVPSVVGLVFLVAPLVALLLRAPWADLPSRLADPRVLPPLMDTSDLPGAHVLVVDDVADSGRTLALVMEMLGEQGAEARSAVLYTKPRTIIQPDYSWKDTDLWITFPWSADPPVDGAQPRPND